MRRPHAPLSSLKFCVAVATMLLASAVAPFGTARAEALLVVEADSGRVLHAENATYPWYPASVTKLMTAYVILKAVKDGRTTLDSLLTVSPVAAAQSPSKMGFKPGTRVTVDNALKMMMVKSANDMAVVLAEGLDGSVEGFADEMNRTAARLGMTQTNYVNPNGLPAEGHVSSARDLAILARAIIRDLPEYEYFVHIPAIKFGKRITRNFNSLIGRYPGADGMKTGFICASGFNLVASATRGNRRLIAVVLGAPSSSMRAYKAAQMLEKGFSTGALSWLTPSLGNVEQLQPINVDPPNLRDDMCGPHRKRKQAPESDDDNAVASNNEGGLSLFAGLQPGQLKPSEILAASPAPTEPVIVYTGPTRTGAALIAANAADAESQKPVRTRKGKKGAGEKQIAAKPDPSEAASKPKPAADAKPAAKPDARVASKPTAAQAAKPAPKPAAKPGEKSSASGDAGKTGNGKKKDAKPVTEHKLDSAPKT